MKKLKNFIAPLHKSFKRDYLDRMLNEKAKCVKIAKKYDFQRAFVIQLGIVSELLRICLRFIDGEKDHWRNAEKTLVKR